MSTKGSAAARPRETAPPAQRAPVVGPTALPVGASSRSLLSRPKPKASTSSLVATDFIRLYQTGPIERVQLVKSGFEARSVEHVARCMNVTKDRLASTIGIARATVDRKVREGKVLSPEESERLLGVSRLVGQVQALVEESGDAAGFDAAAWVAGWLEQPLPALAGQRPADFMDTTEGQRLVANLVARAQSGAFA